MKDLRKAAEQAVEAIMHGGVKEQAAAVYELRQALAQEEKPPVKSHCGGKPNYCTPEVTPDVDAINISAECVDETAKHERDMVNHPPHYKSGGIETIDFIEAKELPYHLGNVVKYISRAGVKSHCPIEDLKKAQWYLNRYVEHMEKTK
jgi:hypothetical protein